MRVMTLHPAKNPMPSALEYIRQLQARGRYHFSTDEACEALGCSMVATQAALRRLKEKRLIADPYRGFHVVLLPQYRELGCLPAEQFVPELMAHLQEPYYACLLSAAAFHGAAHQAPMVFQVMVRRTRRGLAGGSVRVAFIGRADMEATPVVERNTATGRLRIATPEATALELVGYAQHCGYLDNVATVLAELAEILDGPRLVQEARRCPLAWVQRLGYLLGLVAAHDLAEQLEGTLVERQAFPVALAPWKDTVGAVRDARWKVALNVEVEPDL